MLERTTEQRQCYLEYSFFFLIPWKNKEVYTHQLPGPCHSSSWLYKTSEILLELLGPSCLLPETWGSCNSLAQATICSSQALRNWAHNKSFTSSSSKQLLPSGNYPYCSPCWLSHWLAHLFPPQTHCASILVLHHQVLCQGHYLAEK